MQEKRQKKSPIKQRILQFAEKYCDSKRVFYAKTGISRGTLESPTGITEETLVKFFTTFKEVNPIYFLTGEGEIFKKDQQKSDDNTTSPESIDILKSLIKEKDYRIEELCQKIGKLQHEISNLKKENKQHCHRPDIKY